MPHVFISYSRKDTPFINRLEQALRAEGVVTWRDVHSIPGGAKWFRRIKQGLEASYAMLYIDTANAEQSDWVEREFLYAAKLNLPMIPVKPDPDFVSLQTINLNPIVCDEANFVVGTGKIISRLATLPQEAVVSGATAPPEPERAETTASLAPETEIPPDIDLSDEIADYIEWLLVKSHADLRDALYVQLEAQTDTRAQKASDDNPLGFGLDMDFDMGLTKRLPLERIQDDAFDRAGEPVTDARIPIKEAQRVVLLGNPGSGKTTTLLQLAVDLARERQSDDSAPIPVFVPLRKFDGAVPFETFVRSQMYNLQDVYETLLAREDVIFLLDALNEMPRTDNDGRKLVPGVQAFAGNHERWVLSCRVRDYQEELSEIDGVHKVRLKPLDPPRIYEVIQARFREQYEPAGIATADDGEHLWQAMHGSDDLLKAWELFREADKAEAFWQGNWPNSVMAEGVRYIWDNPGYQDWQKMQRDRRRMLPLCRNPYMTKMVCDIYAIDKSLPDNRGALFKKFVDKLLERDRKAALSVGAKWIDDALMRRGLAQIGGFCILPRKTPQKLLNGLFPTEIAIECSF